MDRGIQQAAAVGGTRPPQAGKYAACPETCYSRYIQDFDCPSSVKASRYVTVCLCLDARRNAGHASVFAAFAMPPHGKHRGALQLEEGLTARSHRPSCFDLHRLHALSYTTPLC